MSSTSYLSTGQGEIIFHRRVMKVDEVLSQNIWAEVELSHGTQLQRLPAFQRNTGKVHIHNTSCVCASVYVCMLAYRGLSLLLGVSHCCFPSHLLWWGLALTPGYWLACLAGQWVPGISLSLYLLPGLGLQTWKTTPGFDVGTSGLNSDPHCAANTLKTELSSQARRRHWVIWITLHLIL